MNEIFFIALGAVCAGLWIPYFYYKGRIDSLHQVQREIMKT